MKLYSDHFKTFEILRRAIQKLKSGKIFWQALNQNVIDTGKKISKDPKSLVPCPNFYIHDHFVYFWFSYANFLYYNLQTKFNIKADQQYLNIF